MNEFIVWDKVDNTFCKLASWHNMLTAGEFVYVRKNLDDEVHKIEKELQEDEYEIFNNIGLKDINGKSIYADSSIVEFQYCFGWQLEPTKHIGYFSKNDESLQLEIIFIDDKKYNKQEYSYIYMSSFKIIDTIQENKLGLANGINL